MGEDIEGVGRGRVRVIEVERDIICLVVDNHAGVQKEG
jgi:hypothetical protein